MGEPYATGNAKEDMDLLLTNLKTKNQMSIIPAEEFEGVHR